MKTMRNGQLVDLTPAQNAELQAHRAARQAEHQARLNAEAARLERIATAKANMNAAQSIPDLRAAVAVLFAELGI